MSAWLVTQTHIAALSTALADLGHDPQAVGEVLLRENERSLRYRYDERAATWEPDLSAPFRFNGPVRGPGIAWLVKALDCYDYQACEHPDYPSSQARALILEIERQIGGATEDEAPAVTLDEIRTSSEYARAPWGIEQDFSSTTSKGG